MEEPVSLVQLIVFLLLIWWVEAIFHKDMSARTDTVWVNFKIRNEPNYPFQQQLVVESAHIGSNIV